MYGLKKYLVHLDCYACISKFDRYLYYRTYQLVFINLILIVQNLNHTINVKCVCFFIITQSRIIPYVIM